MLQYIEVTPTLRKGISVTFNKKCYGVSVSCGMIYVSCHDGSGCPDGRGDIRVLDKRGNEIRRIGVSEEGSILFQIPYYVAAKENINMIYVSDVRTNTITCLTSDGDTVYQSKDDDLRGPRGMYVDGTGNIVVCSRDTHSLHVTTAEGKRSKIILMSGDGVQDPQSVAVRPKDGTLVVGCYSRNEIYVYTLV